MSDEKKPGAPPAATRSSADVKSKLTPVVFLKKSPPYNKDEVAGFSEDIAKGLVDQKIARELTAAEIKAGAVDSK